MGDQSTVVAVIGGTGALGLGIARRLALAGYPVVIGSRDAARAVAAATEMNAALGGSAIVGTTNSEAVARAEIVFLAVPFASHAAILDDIGPVVSGKIVVDTTVPLQPPKVSTVHLPPEGSVAVATQNRLGSDVRVVSALHNAAAHRLQKDEAVDCDVLVCGNDKDARAIVVTLVDAMGLRGLEAGPLANSVVAEALTSVLIGINRRYKIDGAGIRITGTAKPS